ncbi:hypothetical protein HD554DRAFT_2043655 [Boletus coccyginus]|nr:hypothetical protein HD554DRAFT_2043655 [Boletus coccyginus]
MAVGKGVGDIPGTCACCKKKKQGCQYSPGKPACRQCPQPISLNPQAFHLVTFNTQQRSLSLKNAESIPQSPERSRHVKHQCQSNLKSRSRSGSNAKLLAIESPPLQSQATTLEAIEEDNYEYHDYSPPDPTESFFFTNLPATQASELVSAMTGIQSDRKMGQSDRETEVNDESQAEEYFDLNLIDDGNSDSGDSGDSDEMEYQVRAA